jgi:signal transduction histidine kinase
VEARSAGAEARVAGAGDCLRAAGDVQLGEHVGDVVAHRLVADDEAAVSATGRADGTGLGLASMHGRAEELGGTLTVAGRPAGGTRLRAALPLAPLRAAVGS